MRITSNRSGLSLDVADWFGHRKIQSGRYARWAGNAPNPSDTKPAWVDYAVAQGLSRGDASAMTKAELVERFG